MGNGTSSENKGLGKTGKAYPVPIFCFAPVCWETLKASTGAGFELVVPAGIEPTTYRLGGGRSIR